MKRWLCVLRGWWETATTSLFWTTGGNVTVDGHIWPWPPRWSGPRPSPDLEWPGLVEYEVLDCETCGLHREGPNWRSFLGSP